MERVPAKWRALRYATAFLSAIAVAASFRRLVLLAGPIATTGVSASLDAGFLLKPVLTRAHVILGAIAATVVPIQLSPEIRVRWPIVHRWLGRVLVVTSLCTAVSGFAMLRHSIGGALEASAIVVYGSALVVTVLAGWRSIRHGDVTRHREWMLRSTAILLGVATTRPIVAVFFATSRVTRMPPSRFFGIAFWIGFSATALAGEWYVRATRHAFAGNRARSS